jgi:hypothetical protein
MAVKLQAEMYILNMLTTMSKVRLTEAQCFLETETESPVNSQMQQLNSCKWTTAIHQEVDRHHTGAIEDQEMDGERTHGKSLYRRTL